MKLNFIKLSNLFYKLAIKSPEWITNEIIKKRLENINDIIKNPKLKNFEEEITIRKNEDLLKSEPKIINYIINALGQLNANNLLDEFKYKNVASSLLKEYNIEASQQEGFDFDVSEELIKHKTWRDLLINNKVQIKPVVYNKNFTKREKEQYFSSFVRGSVFLKELFKTNNYSSIMISDILDGLSKNRQFKKIEGNFKVIFSINYEDILGMSDRSKWKTCVTIEDCKKNKEFTDKYNLSVIGAAINENIGIIYMTQNEDYKGRGPEMIFRSQVWLVKDENKEYLYLQTVYPIPREDIKQIFENLLFKHLQIPIVDSSSAAYKIDVGNIESIYEIPYSDAYNILHEKNEKNEINQTNKQDILKNITNLKNQIIITLKENQHRNFLKENITKEEENSFEKIEELIYLLQNTEPLDIIETRFNRTFIIYSIEEILKDEILKISDYSKAFPLLNELHKEINKAIHLPTAELFI